MANLQRIPVDHGAVFPVPVVCMGVDPVNNFEKLRNNEPDPQDRDKDSGLRLWAVSIIDPHQPPRHRELIVKIAAEHQPVPPAGVSAPVEFRGLQVIPYVEERGEGRRSRIAYSLRAAGFVDPVKVKS